MYLLWSRNHTSSWNNIPGSKIWLFSSRGSLEATEKLLGSSECSSCNHWPKGHKSVQYDRSKAVLWCYSSYIIHLWLPKKDAVTMAMFTWFHVAVGHRALQFTPFVYKYSITGITSVRSSYLSLCSFLNDSSLHWINTDMMLHWHYIGVPLHFALNWYWSDWTFHWTNPGMTLHYVNDSMTLS